ncbi:MAG: rhodanese-like domain-containing protein [Desulfuromonadaceae bacterium]
MKIRTRIAASFVTLLAVTMMAGCETGPEVKSQASLPQTVPAAVQKKDVNKVKGKVKTVVGKSNTLSVEVAEKVMVFKFNSDTVYKNAASYKDIHPGEVLIVEFKVVGAENVATLLSKVVAELPAGTTLIKTEELNALVQKGAEAGKYVMIDSRPAGRYHQAHIPTSVSLPFDAMNKLDKEGKVSPLLPQDKDTLLVFYCGGITCHLSPSAAKLAVKQGYTNVKVYSGGDPDWAKAELRFASSPKFVKDDNILLLDLRAADKFSAGHIPRALSLPVTQLNKYKEADFPEYKGALIVFYSDNQADVETALELMLDYGFTKATYFPGGLAKWLKIGNAAEVGAKPAPAKLTYVRVLAANEVSIGDFMKAVTGSGVLILDARSTSEFAAGKFRTAVNIPSEEMEQRFAEVPKDKPVYLHCATGSRAEMAYDILKAKGYTNVKVLKANISFEGDKYKITE